MRYTTCSERQFTTHNTRAKSAWVLRVNIPVVDRDRRVSIRAVVDTGATEIIVTPEVARELGFDLEEVSRITVTLADGRRVPVPGLRGVEIHFGDRCFLSEALVLDGGECLVGVVPLEVMDLIVDPKRQQRRMPAAMWPPPRKCPPVVPVCAQGFGPRVKIES